MGDTVAGPSQSRRPPETHYKALSDAAPPPRRSSEHLMSDRHDRPSPPQYSEIPRTETSERCDDGAREALLGTPSIGGSRKTSDDERSMSLRSSEQRQAVASLSEKKALWWKNVLITGMFVASWYGFATLLSLYNKWMFSPEYYGFSFPLFVTFCHMIVQFVLASIIRVVFAKQFRPVERPTRQAYVTRILPTAVSTGGDIGLSNLSLKTITLSLYTMCKSSTLIFVLGFAFLFHLEKYSFRLVAVISLIFLGVFLMVFNTTAVSIPGIIMVFSASGLAGLRWALTELVMHKKAMGLSNPFATIYWLAPLMALTLGVVSAILEGWSQVFASDHFAGGKALMTVGVIILPGAIAFAMVSSEYFIIQRAGVVPLSIAGIFKEVTTISFSLWVFGDKLTELNIIGVIITIFGIATYTYHKYQKSISSTVAVDAHGNLIESGNASPVDNAPPRLHVTAADENIPRRASDGLPLDSLADGSSHRDGRAHAYPPEETSEERANRLRDEFEGWNREDEWSDEDESIEEMERRRLEKSGTVTGTKSWGSWWEKEM